MPYRNESATTWQSLVAAVEEHMPNELVKSQRLVVDDSSSTRAIARVPSDATWLESRLVATREGQSIPTTNTNDGSSPNVDSYYCSDCETKILDWTVNQEVEEMVLCVPLEDGRVVVPKLRWDGDEEKESLP